MIEWKAVREAASQFLPKHTAVAAAWKHRNLSYVEQERLLPMPKDRGAEPGDVDGPFECSLALGMVAAEMRMCIAAEQAAGSLQWIGAQTTQPDCRNQPTLSLGGLEKRTGAHDPRHKIQKKGGLADLWYMDDCDIMCHPTLVPSHLREFDDTNAKVERRLSPT